MIVPNIHLLVIEAPAVAREVKPGQFVILRANDDGERIPLSIADWDREKGTITVAVMTIGGTTIDLAAVKEGESIPTVVGPLGIRLKSIISALFYASADATVSAASIPLPGP